MKRLCAAVLSFTILFLFTACGRPTDSNNDNLSSFTDYTDISSAGAVYETKEETDMQKITITVGDKTFSGHLYNNKTAEVFKALLPLTLNMSELNGNEKYYYLKDSLPTDAVLPDSINTGDIMLYGNSCLVLFYKNFSTAYSYTKIGYLEETLGLEEALGRGDAEITFKIN